MNPDPEPPRSLVVIGGGAAGFFGAITAAERGVEDILILEKTREVLTKVRISGGGRCNVTHACFDPAELVKHFPRGHRNLRGPFQRWRTEDTIAWFEERGVPLKTEEDGRMFPTTDNSLTIVSCLTEAARELGVAWKTQAKVERVGVTGEGVFTVECGGGEVLRARNVLIATGGIRSRDARDPAEAFDHAMEPAVPSLFSFHIDDSRLEGLQGVSVPQATVRAAGHEASGPLLITHWGLSGPAVLKLSAWAARELAECDYQFPLEVNWTGSRSASEIRELVARQRKDHGARLVDRKSQVEGITHRLWTRLCAASGIGADQTWSRLTGEEEKSLAQQLTAAEFEVRGKSLNKEEFVTCGGVRLDDVDLKTMQSRQFPGLYFAGEVLDIDGITGGFNFQAAWTTGRLAGEAIAMS